MSPNVTASIKARLLNEAKRRGEQLELLLVRFVCERFLYRLGASDLRGRCTLKGAGLLSLWMPDPYRATRDVDLLASGENDEATVRASMLAICRTPCPEDGLDFDLESLVVTPIRDQQKYAGQRAMMRVFLGQARTRLQVDFGFGDALSLPPEDAELPTLIDRIPAPRVRVYPRVATVAEKFEAMVHLGRRNSRMKDFHDLWALSEAFDFAGDALQRAVAQCFARRGTSWTTDLPDVLTAAFYSDADMANRWRAYLARGPFRTPPPEAHGEVGARIRDFLGPVRETILNDESFEMRWPAGGPWKSDASGPGL